jgi:hypothetical protein
VQYQHVEGNAVRFYIHMQWKRTAAFGGSSDHDHRAQTGDSVEVLGAAGAAAGPVMFDTGDNKQHRVVMTVTDYSAHPADDYVYGYTKIMHAYPTQSNGRKPWVAVLRGCCRQGDGTEFRVTTYVDLVGAPQSLAVQSMPVIVVPEGNVTVVHLPANTVGGAPGRYWRMAQGAELGGLVNPVSQRVFFNLTDYLTGRLTVDTRCNASLSCPLRAGANVFVGIMVAGWYGKAFAPAEFRLKVASSSDWDARPMFYGPAAAMSEVEGVAGYEMFLTLYAMSGHHVLDQHGRRDETRGCLQAIRVQKLPEGAMLSRAMFVSASSCVNRSVDFRWTPGPAHVGTHTLCFDAVDEARRQSAQQCLRLVVRGPLSEGPPRFTSPAPNEHFLFYMRRVKSILLLAESSNPYEVSLSLSLSLYIYTHTHIHTHIHIYCSPQTCLSIYTYIHMYIYICIYIHIYIYTYTYIYIHVLRAPSGLGSNHQGSLALLMHMSPMHPERK